MTDQGTGVTGHHSQMNPNSINFVVDIYASVLALFSTISAPSHSFVGESGAEVDYSDVTIDSSLLLKPMKNSEELNGRKFLRFLTHLILLPNFA